MVRLVRQIAAELVDVILNPVPGARGQREKIGVEGRVVNLKRANQLDPGWRVRGFRPCAISCSERAIFAANAGVNSS